MGRYCGEDYDRNAPCAWGKHNWAMDGTCWRCGWTRQEIARFTPPSPQDKKSGQPS